MITEEKIYSLGQIAFVKTGVYRKSSPDGKIVQVQKSHFDDAGQLLTEALLPDLEDDHRLHKHFIKGGEVLLTSKGEYNTAYLFRGAELPTVASSMFLVLSIFEKGIAAEYLTWYLNTSDCQRLLNRLSRGSAVHSISKRDLLEVAIPVPSMERQRAILEIAALQQQEFNLLREILLQKQLLGEAQLLQLAKSMPL